MDHHRAQQQQHAGMQPQMMSSSAESGLQLLGNLNNSSNASGGNGNSLAGSDDPAPFNPIKSLLQQLQQQQRDEEQQVNTFFLNFIFPYCLSIIIRPFFIRIANKTHIHQCKIRQKGPFCYTNNSSNKNKEVFTCVLNLVQSM